MNLIDRIKNKLFRTKLPERFQNSKIQNLSLISDQVFINKSNISGNVRIKEHVRLNEVTISGNITIGNNTSIWGPNSDIYTVNNIVEIGNFCSIARNVSIQGFNHIYDRCTSYFIFQNVFGHKDITSDVVSNGNIEIGHDVWIGTQCVILSGSKIGNGAVIAANSVVNSEIPPFAIAAGSPAKVIKYRFENEIIEMLTQLEWWYWPKEKIILNRELFEGKLTIEKLNKINN